MDITLGDGREINLDLSKIKYREYANLKSPAFLGDDDLRIMSDVTGLSQKELDELSMDDMRRIVTGIIKKCGQPLLDPN